MKDIIIFVEKVQIKNIYPTRLLYNNVLVLVGRGYRVCYHITFLETYNSHEYTEHHYPFSFKSKCLLVQLVHHLLLICLHIDGESASFIVFASIFLLVFTLLFLCLHRHKIFIICRVKNCNLSAIVFICVCVCLDAHDMDNGTLWASHLKAVELNVFNVDVSNA